MFDSPLEDSAYVIIGEEPGADEQALRRAYRQRLREAHPDTGGDVVAFRRVQRAWELIGTAASRAAYDRVHGESLSGESNLADSPDAPRWRPPAAPTDSRPRARSYGHPGGLRREQYLELIREWAGRGSDLADPYRPALVRSAPSEVRHLLADALAEEATARIVSGLGIGYTVWHDVAVADRGDPRAKLDHIVLGPSGLYGVASEDFGGPASVRRRELRGDGVIGTPIGTLLHGMRSVARTARVRFSGAIVVLPDDDVAMPIAELGTIRGKAAAISSRSTLADVLRRGITGARPVGGQELFDIRTRLQHTVRFV